MEPLRELNEGEKETTAKMTEDAARVAELFEKLGKKMHLTNQETESENRGQREKGKEEKHEDGAGSGR